MVTLEVTAEFVTTTNYTINSKIEVKLLSYKIRSIKFLCQLTMPLPIIRPTSHLAVIQFINVCRRLNRRERYIILRRLPKPNPTIVHNQPRILSNLLQLSLKFVPDLCHRQTNALRCALITGVGGVHKGHSLEGVEFSPVHMMCLCTTTSRTQSSGTAYQHSSNISWVCHTHKYFFNPTNFISFANFSK